MEYKARTDSGKYQLVPINQLKDPGLAGVNTIAGVNGVPRTGRVQMQLIWTVDSFRCRSSRRD
jgi:hypothetical protein